jgi:hypothetical protein
VALRVILLHRDSQRRHRDAQRRMTVFIPDPTLDLLRVTL